jgi:hypothetical protein
MYDAIASVLDEFHCCRLRSRALLEFAIATCELLHPIGKYLKRLNIQATLLIGTAIDSVNKMRGT